MGVKLLAMPRRRTLEIQDAPAFALFLPVPLGQWLGIEYANDPCTCSSAAV
jgi:hypothetical protein